MVDLDLDALYARGLSPNDVSAAISNQNLIIPAGTVKMGAQEYNVKLNSSPDVIAAFNDIPIRTVNGVPIFVKNVAHVADGYAVQTNMVRRDGRRAVLMTILKAEGASTLSVVNQVLAALPGIQAQLPPELKLEPLFDQSVFVPVVFLTGPASYLFTPLALAVVFAMLASYFLSRTLVPTMVLYLLPKEAEAEGQSENGKQASPRLTLWSVLRHPSLFHDAFN